MPEQFIDIFTDNHNQWPQESTDAERYSLDPHGGYIIDHHKPAQGRVIWKEFPLDPNAPFRLQALIERLGGEDDYDGTFLAPTSTYGLAWAVRDNNNLCCFMLSHRHDHYMIGRAKDSVFYPDRDWRPIPSSIQVKNVNLFEVRREAVGLVFYLNDCYVTMVMDSVRPKRATSPHNQAQTSEQWPGNGMGVAVTSYVRIKVRELRLEYEYLAPSSAPNPNHITISKPVHEITDCQTVRGEDGVHVIAHCHCGEIIEAVRTNDIEALVEYGRLRKAHMKS